MICVLCGRVVKRVFFQAGCENRVDFGLDLYRDIPIVPLRIPTPLSSFEVLTPEDLDALEVEETELGPVTDICEAGNIQHERPMVYHEIIVPSSSSSSDVENSYREQEVPVVREDSNLDSMPE